MTKDHRIVIETGKKKVFASAIDWPGWSRSGKTEEEALQVLADYAERYQKVAELAGVRGVKATADEMNIIERVNGTTTTDFGAPDVAAGYESDRMTDVECERQIALLRSCWEYFDDAASSVSEELQRGPRGGGRNRTMVVEHTLEAERSYARNVGVKTPKGGMDTAGELKVHRDAVCQAIYEHNARGESARKWPLRYFIRRAAWHVLDHAWEMEDKDLTGKDT